MMRTGLIVVTATFVALAGFTGCAKKKEAPPRGVVFGKADFSDAQVKGFSDEQKRAGKNFDESSHCLQPIERNDGTKVVELSDVGCPADGSLLPEHYVIAVMKFYSNISDAGQKTFLVMGQSPVMDQNVDVAVITNVSKPGEALPSFEVDSMCLDIPNFPLSKNCKVNYSDRGTINGMKIDFSRSVNVVRRGEIEALHAEDIAIRKDMDTMKQSLNARISRVRKSLQARLTKARKKLEAEDKRIEKKGDEAVTKLKEKDEELTAKANNLEDRILEEELAAAEEEARIEAKLDKSVGELQESDKKLGRADKELGQRIASEEFAALSEEARIEGLVNGLQTKLTEAQTALQNKDGELSSSIQDLEWVQLMDGLDIGDLVKEIKDLNRMLTQIQNLDENTENPQSALAKTVVKFKSIEAKLASFSTSLEGKMDKPAPEPQKPEAPPLPEKADEPKKEEAKPEAPKPEEGKSPESNQGGN